MPLRYRRLHWLHNEWIKDRCMMFGGPITTLPGSNPRLDGLLWDKAAGQVQCDRLHKCGPYPIAPIPVGLCKRCRGVHHLSPTQTILIPTETVEIAVSVLAEDEHTFITGFKLVYRDISPSVYFGYQIPHKQIKVDLRGQALAGFEVFAGEGGIQAIRPIFDDKHGKCHSIIGKPNATCQSVLLTPVGVIRAFSAVFDLEFAFATSESVSKY
ncbi:hypothetical protein N7454_007027 [Penicillium verhagenii]|nr:hypothetical protein N7454_007027 [Penicillium verhagenii]